MNKLPISPHLSIYRVQITSLMSVIHRATGIIIFFALSMGILSFSIMTYDRDMINIFVHIVGCKYAKILFFFFICVVIWSIAYHLSNGIRFLWIDVSAKVNNTIITRTAYVACIFALIFGIAYMVFLW